MTGNRFVAFAAWSILLSLSGFVQAQGDAEQRVTAEALFRHGKELMAQGDYAEACEAFRDSNRVDPAVGTEMNLADCYEKSGRTTSAWTTFRAAAQSAHRAGQTEREQICQARAAALEPLLARIIVAVSPYAAQLISEIRRDGRPLTRTAWGIPVPVDPGDHEIEAVPRAAPPWKQRVQAVQGKVVTVDVLVPHQDTVARAAQAPAAIETARSRPSPKARAVPPDVGAGEASTMASGGNWGTQKILGASLAGGGVVLMGASAILGLVAKSKYDDAGKYCSPEGCAEPGFSDRTAARSQANVASIVLGLGAASTIGGGVLFFTARPAPAGVGVAIDASPLTRSVALRGVF